MSDLDRILKLASHGTADAQSQAPAEREMKEEIPATTEAVGEFADPILDLCDDLGCDSDHPVLGELIRYLDGDTIKDFVADFRRHNDMNHPGEDGDYGDDDKNFESVKEATHSDAKPIYDLVGSLGAGKIELAKNPIFHNLVRFLDADTIEKFVADFRKKLDNGESIEEEQVDEWVQDQDWSESVKWAEKELGRKITNEEKEELKEIFWLPALAGAASRIPASTYAGAITGAGHFAGKAKNWIKKKLKLNNSRFEEDHKVDEWVQDQDAGNWSMWTAQERSFIQELCLRHDGVERDPAGLKYLGKSELWDEGNILKDKGKLTTLMLWVKKNKDDIEGRFTRMFKVYSKDNNNGQSDGNQVLQNIIGKIGKVDGVTEDTLDVTPKGYGPDDYDEKDVAPEAHGGDLEKMQDAYKYNEDRNNH